MWCCLENFGLAGGQDGSEEGGEVKVRKGSR